MSDTLPYRQTFPNYHTIHRAKPRRIPLVLRLTKGSIHSHILLPVILHMLFTFLILLLDMHVRSVGLPGTVIPSLSIVVGLMLVFRNSTSYDRFWAGRNAFSNVVTGARDLSRMFMVYSRNLNGDGISEEEMEDTERAVRMCLAIVFAVMNHLRGEFAPEDGDTGNNKGRRYEVYTGSWWANLGLVNWERRDVENGGSKRTTGANTPLMSGSVQTLRDGAETRPVYTSLLRSDTLASLEGQGIALPYQISLSIEAFIRRGQQRNWWQAPQAAMLSNTLNALIAEWAKMDTIRLTPVPLAHVVHARQVLALYLTLLPFAIVESTSWWAIPVMALVAFTLYGIEGIGRQLEDPFGYERNDIKMDAICKDAQVEIEGILAEWKNGRDSGSIIW